MFQFAFPVNLRILFALSMLSNLPAGTTGGANTIIKYAKPKIAEVLNNAPAVDNISLKDWQLVWGPAVKTKPGSPYINGESAASNAMCVFRDPGGDNYVIGIQATNPYSNYDWLVENGEVLTTVPWRKISKGSQANIKARISKGAYIGLCTLLYELKDDSIAGNPTIVQYLKSLTGTLKDKKINIIVDGHSLGGALGPVLALYLMENKNEWANNTTTPVYCFSTAGPTVGNDFFASYFNNQFKDRAIRIWNRLDLVPRAWVKDSIEFFKGDHGAYSLPGKSVEGWPFFMSACATNCEVPEVFKPMASPGFINIAIAILPKFCKKRYTPICNNGFAFNGAPGGPYINVPQNGKPGYVTFLEEVGQQHMTAYMMQFNIMAINTYAREVVFKDPNSIVNRCDLNQRKWKLPVLVDVYGSFEALYQNSWGW